MGNNLVITIGRQCGSGGKLIGEKLAKELGVKCYDKELLTRAAKESGMSEALFESHDEKPTNSFLYSLVMDSYSMGYATSSYMDMPINHKIFLAQFETIKKIAQEESCVIVGRCADYALADNPNLISVFIVAEDEDKIARIMIKTDKRRSGYYNYYSSKRWGDVRSYDLCINSSRLGGVDGCVEAIKSYIEVRKKFHQAPAKQ